MTVTSSPLRIGVHTPPQRTSIADLVTVWRRVDQLGFDWISVWDHLRPVDGEGPNFEAVALHAALATVTERVQVGCLVYCVGYHHAARLAAAATTIDHLSGGRAVIGLGAGYLTAEYETYGFPFEPPGRRVDRLAATFDAVRRLLDGERVTVDDGQVLLREALLEPRPVQARLPIWIGGGGERRTLPLAGRVADGWNIPMATVEDVARKNAVVTAAAEAAGRDPAAIERSVNLGLCWDEADGPTRFGDRWAALRPAVLSGGADRILEQLGAYRAAGVDRVMLSLRPPLVVDELERFAAEILPELR
jgi:alkanesulfonate monooxygenase SsuD/methylene tetrahydromethanopterin reductase-like flavin-dependent oxidoreductase (luciferase family)